MTLLAPSFLQYIRGRSLLSSFRSPANQHSSNIIPSFAWSRLFQSTIDHLYQTHLHRGNTREYISIPLDDYPVTLQFHSGCRIWISPKVICLWSLAWVQCETTYYTRSSFLHEFHWVSIKRISLYVVSKFYKYYWIRVTTVMITLRVRYVFWSTFCSMKGGESLDSILFSLRSGKQSTLPNHRYRVWYHIGLRWLASAVWFTSSSTGVYYDEGNSRPILNLSVNSWPSTIRHGLTQPPPIR